MKKIVMFIMAMLVVASASTVSASAVSKPIEVYYNGSQIEFPDQQPLIYNGRTLVPVRMVAEALHFDVFWDNQKREVQIFKDQKFIFWTIGESCYRTNNCVLIETECPATIENGRTMVPLRFIAEQLGDIRVDFVSIDKCNMVLLYD